MFPDLGEMALCRRHPVGPSDTLASVQQSNMFQGCLLYTSYVGPPDRADFCGHAGGLGWLPAQLVAKCCLVLKLLVTGGQDRSSRTDAGHCLVGPNPGPSVGHGQILGQLRCFEQGVYSCYWPDGGWHYIPVWLTAWPGASQDYANWLVGQT